MIIRAFRSGEFDAKSVNHCAFAALCLAAAVLAGCSEGPPPSPGAVAVEGCVTAGCHQQVEQIHYGGPQLACVDCHGGNPQATTKAGAHVTVDVSFNPSTPGSQLLDDPPMAALDALPPEVIRFINPADYRVVRATCGSSIMAGGNCHTTIAENSLLLNRATLVGTLAGGGFFAGTQDQVARYGVVATKDQWTPEILAAGAVAAVDRLPEDVPDHVTDPIARAFYPVFEQLCLECHTYRDGPKVPGRYYSSGCNACHMLTSDSSRAETADPTQDRGEPGHVQTHRLTNRITDRQCARCHISHLGRALLSQGIRERSEPEGDKLVGGPNRGVEDPEHHVPWAESNYVKYQGMRQLFGKPYPFFIEDEDGTNDVDETPPDIHTEKGLGCIDCHNIREAHGDKQMAGRMDFEIDVRCSNCHGRPGEPGPLLSDAGLAFSQAGTAVGGTGHNDEVFTTAADGTVRQLGKLSRHTHPVTQITRRTDPMDAKYNLRTRMGCELHAGTPERRAAVKAAVRAAAAADPASVPELFPGLTEGFTFPESAEPETQGRVACFTCHNAWTLNCYGCHMVRDDREFYTSRLTGEKRRGRIASYGLSVVADALAMGFDGRGRITPMVGTSVFFTHIAENGTRPIDAAAVPTASGITGDGNVHNPVHHHTVRRQPRDCDGCHPSDTGSHDDNALLRAVGLGTGQYTFIDGDGRVHWLDRLVRADLDGDGIPDPLTPGTLPDALFAVWRAASSTHPAWTPGSQEPGPLDAVTIRRVLETHVVPQRPKPPTDKAPGPEGPP